MMVGHHHLGTVWRGEGWLGAASSALNTLVFLHKHKGIVKINLGLLQRKTPKGS